MLNFDMNIVTTEPGNINAKEKIFFIFTAHNTCYKQKQYAISLITGTAKHSFGNKDPFIRNIFEKY